MAEYTDTKYDTVVGIIVGAILLLVWWAIISGVFILSDTQQPQDFLRAVVQFDVLSLLLVVLCVYYIIQYRQVEMQTLQESNKDLTNAAVGEIVEVSGTVVTGEFSDRSLFGYDAPLVREWTIENAFKPIGRKWKTVQSGLQDESFLIQSDNDIEATIDTDGVFKQNQDETTSTPSNIALSLGRQHERETVKPSEDIPPAIDSFLRRENIDVTEIRDEGGSLLPAIKTRHVEYVIPGTLRFTEKDYLKDGDDLFIRGVLQNKNRTEPDEIGFDTDRECVIADTKRDIYISSQIISMYATATFTVLSVVSWVIAALYPIESSLLAGLV